MPKWTPIFEQAGQEFVVPYASMVGSSKEEAWKIGKGVMFVEGILMQFSATGRYLELDDQGRVTITGRWSTLGAWDVIRLETRK